MLYRPDHARLLVFPFVFIGFVISLCLHEFGHAIVAYHCGDRTVRDKGYLTLDPLRYTDLQYSILFPLLIMALGGIGLPGGAVYINTHVSAPARLWCAGVGGRAARDGGRARGLDGGACGGAAIRRHRAGAVCGAGVSGAAAGDGADVQSHPVSRPRRLGHHRAVPAGAVARARPARGAVRDPRSGGCAVLRARPEPMVLADGVCGLCADRARCRGRRLPACGCFSSGADALRCARNRAATPP